MKAAADRLTWARTLCEKLHLRVTPARELVLAKMAEHAIISEGGKAREVYVDSIIPAVRERNVGQTLFVGYSEDVTSALVVGLVKGDKLVETLSDGESGQIILDQTSFYAESGGQVGDTGWIDAEDGAFEVEDTKKDSGYFFHFGTVTAGDLRVGDRVTAKIDTARRASIRRNHTTTHLMHKALQEVLGSHVQQRGSMVAPDRLRFDFSHDRALTAAQLREVEGIVNERILDDLPVVTMEKPIDEAKEMGAMMLFDEKYGDVVRVVQAGDFSLEFCGGTHLQHTSQAGLFKVISEGSTQAGVRRIEAVTGRQALMRLLDQERLLADIAGTVKTSPPNALSAVQKLQSTLKERERELAALQKAAAGNLVEELVGAARSEAGTSIVRYTLTVGGDNNTMRTLSDEVLNRLKSGVIILGAIEDGKVALTIKVSKDLNARGVDAGKLVREAAKVVGGGGGGRPDFAQAGGKDPSRLSEALETAERLALAAIGG